MSSVTPHFTQDNVLNPSFNASDNSEADLCLRPEIHVRNRESWTNKVMHIVYPIEGCYSEMSETGSLHANKLFKNEQSFQLPSVFGCISNFCSSPTTWQQGFLEKAPFANVCAVRNSHFDAR